MMARHERLVDVVSGEGDDQLFGRFASSLVVSRSLRDRGDEVGRRRPRQTRRLDLAHHRCRARRASAVCRRGAACVARREGDGFGTRTAHRRRRGTPIRSAGTARSARADRGASRARWRRCRRALRARPSRRRVGCPARRSPCRSGSTAPTAGRRRAARVGSSGAPPATSTNAGRLGAMSARPSPTRATPPTASRPAPNVGIVTVEVAHEPGDRGDGGRACAASSPQLR